MHPIPLKSPHQDDLLTPWRRNGPIYRPRPPKHCSLRGGPNCMKDQDRPAGVVLEGNRQCHRQADEADQRACEFCSDDV